jgi:hypothetical protein
MFIQVIQAPCTRRDDVRQVLDSWSPELAAGARGYLGGTFGITDDDQLIGVVRFSSREDAMANSERPEQGAWAERLAAALDGPPEFRDYDDVRVFLDGGSDDAGFVQVIQGKVEDRSVIDKLLATTGDLRAMRPEVIGGIVGVADDGTFTETIAFTDEESARKGEQLEPPPEVRQLLGEIMTGATYHDLHDPWFESA